MTTKSASSLAREVFEPLLRSRGFRYRSGGQGSGFSTALFIGDKRALAVEFDDREGLIQVSVCRVEEGEIATNPLVIRESSVLSAFNVDDFLVVSEGREAPIGRLANRDDPSEMKRAVEAYAKAVERHGSELLDGEFQVPVAVEKMIKRRLPR